MNIKLIQTIISFLNITMEQTPATTQKALKSILNTQGKRNSQRSVSFRGIEIEVVSQYPSSVERPQKVGLFGIVRLLKQKTEGLLGPSFNKIRQISQTKKNKYSNQNINSLNMLIRLLVTKRLSNGLNSINKTFSHNISIVQSQISNEPSFSKPPLKTFKRTSTLENLHTQSQRSLKSVASYRSNDSRSVKSTDQVISKQDSQRLMCLSQQAKKSLLQMQRFDRFIYVMQSQKRLKGPIEAQLKRLQKIKNHYKCMRDSYFDNQLTITCLYNHMKNMYEMNRDLGQIVKLKAQIERLQQKIIDNNVKHTAALKQAKTGSNAKLAEDAALLKQYLKTNESLIDILRDSSNQDKTRKQLQTLIKKTPEQRRQLICLIQSRISTQSQSMLLDNTSSIYTSEISKLLEIQQTNDKSIKHIERLKKGFTKSLNETSSFQQQQTYSQLNALSDKLIQLHSGNAKGDKQTTSAQVNKLKMDIQSLNSKCKDLEIRSNILTETEQSIKSFQQIISTINKKLQSEQNYLGDIVKNKKILNSRKNSIVSKVFVQVLNVLEILNKNDKKRELQTLQSKLKELEGLNKNLTQELSQYKSNSQSNEFSKLLNMFPNDVQIPELTKIRKYIELNKRKLPSYQTLLFNIQFLINSALDYEKDKQKWVHNLNKIDQQKQRQITNMEQIYINIGKALDEKDTNLNKIRKLLEAQIKKVEANMNEYQSYPLYPKSLKILERLALLAEDKNTDKALQNSKHTEQIEKIIMNHRQEAKNSAKTKDQQILNLRNQIKNMSKSKQSSLESITKSYNDLSKSMDDKIRLEDQLRRQLQNSRRNVEELRRAINQLNQETAKMRTQNKEIAVLRSEVNRLRTETQQLQNLKKQSIQLGRLKKQRQMELKREKQEANRSRVQTQSLNSLRQQINRLNQLIAQNQQQLNRLRLENHELPHLKLQHQQLLKLRQSNQQLQHIKIQNQQLNRFKQQNQQLLTVNSQLKTANQSLSQELSQVKLQLQSSLLSNSQSIPKHQSDRLSTDNLQLQSNISHLNSQLSQITLNNNSLVSQVNNLKLQNKRLQNQIGSVRREKQSLQQSILQLNKQIQILKQEKQSKTSASNPNNSYVNSKERYYEQLSNSLKAENHQLRYELSERSSGEQISINRSSIINNLPPHDSYLKDQNQKLSRTVYESNSKIDSLQKERSKFLNQISKITNQKTDIGKVRDNLQKQIAIYKNQIKQLQQNQVNNNFITADSRKTTSHVVVRSDINSLKTQELQRQVKRLTTLLQQTQNQHLNQINKLKFQQNVQYIPQIKTSISPKNSHHEASYDLIARQKSLLESQNKRLASEVSSLLQKQKQSTSESITISNQLKWAQQDNQQLISKQNNLRKMLEDAGAQNRRLSQSHRLQLNTLSQTIRKITNQNFSMEAKLKGLQTSPSTSHLRQDFMQQEIQNRKRNESYLQQKLKSLELNNGRLNNFIRELQIQSSEQLKQVQKLRQQNIILQRSSSSRNGIPFVGQLEDRFSQILIEKTVNLQKIELLQNALYKKDIKVIRMFELKESLLKQIISEMRKTQMDLRKANDNINSDRILILAKQIDNLVGRFEVYLLDTIKQKAQENSFGLQQSKRKRYSYSSEKSTQFIESTNIVLHNLLVFLTSQKWLEYVDIELPQQSESYFEDVERFLIELFERVFEKKNEVLDKQAHQLLMLRQKMEDLIDQQIQQIQGNQSDREEEFDIGETKRKASIIALQHLFKLYLKTKSPKLLKQILQMLNIQDD